MGWSDEFSFRDCPWCSASTVHMSVHGSATVRPALANQAPRLWTWLTCPRCGGAVMVETNGATSNPPREKRAVPSEAVGTDVTHLPPDVERYYRSALRVLAAGEPEAAAVQLRRALEAAAAHHDAQAANLVKSIEKLIEAGLITRSFGAVLDHIRKVGNQGAHATDEEMSPHEVDLALRFTTQVLRNLFEIPAELAGVPTTPPPES